MTARKFLLPPLDVEGRKAALHDLVLRHHRRNLVTSGWIEDVYPDERGWINQQ